MLGFDYAAGDRLAKLIPDPIMGRAPSFEDCLKDGQPLRKACDEDADARQIVGVARGLEGIVRNSSIHAAAVVIADRPLTDIVPLQLADAGTDESGERAYRMVTQFSMKPIEQIGLLKMDFLGLRNLDVIEDALDIIERSTGEARLDMTRIGVDDERTYEMLARGDSVGVFQFESEGMREALRKVRPTEFEDLIALNALYRPGAMDQIPIYARGKHSPESISYPDERLRSILESSKGVILYQEQAMQIAKELAGFSGAKADDLRKAIGKKNRAAMAALKPEFVEGCRASGTRAEVIEFLWQTNEKSADYSFNRSHAACYALIGYRTAWLKANYPAEYMAALISSVMSTKDKVPFFVARCEEMGIEILPPDVNVSDHEFTVVEGNIRFGLDAVKGVGFQAVEAIKRAREEGGPFTSLWDFCERVDARTVNKKAIEALIKCGALGSTAASRKGMLDVLEQAQAAGQKIQQDALIGQASIFDLDDDAAGGGAAAAPGLGRPVHPPIPAEEFEQRELLAAEKEAIGLFVSAHPLKPMREAMRERVDCPISALEDRRDKETVTVGGIITEAKRIRTRNGDPMMFATLDDLAGSVELLVFGKALSEHEEALKVDEVVVVKGRVDHKEAGKTCVVVQSVERFAPSREEIEQAQGRAQAAERSAELLARPVRLPVAEGDLSPDALADLRHTIENYPGQAEVVLEISTRSGVTRRVRLGDAFRVQNTPAARAELMQALDAGAGVGGDGLAVARRLAGDGCAGERLAPAQGEAALAQLHRQAHFLERRPFALLAGCLEHARQPLQAGRREERRAALLAELARSEVGVAVAVGAERRLRVVEVQRADPPRAERAPGLAQHRVHLGGRADVVARGEQVARVEAHPQPLLAAGGVEQPRELLEGAPERAAGPRRVLEVQLAPLALCERLADRCSRARDRGGNVALLGRTRVEDHAGGADAAAHAQGVRERGERFRADLGVLARAVQQVDAVDQDGVDRGSTPSPP